MTNALIIDTDVATGVWHEGRPRDVDDGFAIATALNAADIELVGVTTTYGNAPLIETTRVAAELVAIHAADTGDEVKVIAGASGPIDQGATEIPETNDAVEFIASELRRRRLKIAAIGPLTNMGILAANYPELMSKIDEVIIVGGRTKGNAFYLGEVGPVRDFNFENDVRAARLMMDSGVPVVMTGFELTSQVVLSKDNLDAIVKSDTPMADYLYTRSLDWIAQWQKRFPEDPGFHPWDSAAIAWIRRPDLFRSEKRGWQINLIDKDRDLYWLETAKDLPGHEITFCYGFEEGGAENYIREIINSAV